MRHSVSFLPRWSSSARYCDRALARSPVECYWLNLFHTFLTHPETSEEFSFRELPFLELLKYFGDACIIALISGFIYHMMHLNVKTCGIVYWERGSPLLDETSTLISYYYSTHLNKHFGLPTTTKTRSILIREKLFQQMCIKMKSFNHHWTVKNRIIAMPQDFLRVLSNYDMERISLGLNESPNQILSEMVKSTQ